MRSDFATLCRAVLHGMLSERVFRSKEMGLRISLELASSWRCMSTRREIAALEGDRAARNSEKLIVSTRQQTFQKSAKF